MRPPGRRTFQREIGKRRYRKLFVIAVEGSTTEQQYFAIFNSSLDLTVHIHCLRKNDKSSPPHVLKRMKNYLKEKGLRHDDKPWEAWLVVDKDKWTDQQLIELFEWSQGRENYGFALSNPKFEYWLLLHFEDGAGIGSSRECSNRLKRYLPDYDKRIEVRKITRDRIDDAVRRAKERDNPPCSDWPRMTGSTVYRLVDRLLEKSP
jgi:hypothetical protein